MGRQPCNLVSFNRLLRADNVSRKRHSLSNTTTRNIVTAAITITDLHFAKYHFPGLIASQLSSLTCELLVILFGGEFDVCLDKQTHIYYMHERISI